MTEPLDLPAEMVEAAARALAEMFPGLAGNDEERNYAARYALAAALSVCEMHEERGVGLLLTAGIREIRKGVSPCNEHCGDDHHADRVRLVLTTPWREAGAA